MGKTRKGPVCSFKRTTLKKKKTLPASFNLFDLRYESPKKKDLAVGFVFFNPAKSKRLLMNYLYTVEKMKLADIPYYTMEMYETEPEISDAFHVKTDFILFQKERLCYLLEKKIPKEFTKLLFMDCDLVFDNKNWYTDVSAKLDTFNIVQPFSDALWLDITYRNIVKHRVSFVFYNKFGYNKEENTKDGYITGRLGKYHPGFAWAFQRSWFTAYGFFMHTILGNGDAVSSISWLGFNKYPPHQKYFNNLINEYNILLEEKPSICLINGTIYHLWHGSRNKRRYTYRRMIFKNVKDIRDILTTDSNGLFKLKNDLYKSKIRAYFQNRDDDGLDV
jgi:hypothetical protein